MRVMRWVQPVPGPAYTPPGPEKHGSVEVTGWNGRLYNLPGTEAFWDQRGSDSHSLAEASAGPKDGIS